MKKRSILFTILIIAILSAVSFTPALADGKTRQERFCDVFFKGEGTWDDETQTCTAPIFLAFAICGPDKSLVWFYFPGNGWWTLAGGFMCVPTVGDAVDVGGELDIWRGNCGAHIMLAPSAGTVHIVHNFPWFVNFFGPARPPAQLYKGYCSVVYKDSGGNILPSIGDVSSVYWNLDASSRYHLDNGTIDIIILVDGHWQSCGATVYEFGDFGRAVCHTSARTFALGRP